MSPSLSLPTNSAPTDDAPTVISKNLIRPATAEDALNGLRGRRLAHFELLEAIGVGGMAAVLRARDTQLDRIVALKILPPEMAQDPENVRRFHQEARSAAKLDHENIARVFFCGEDQRLHFIAFEFVEGDNLRTVLEKRGRLPVGEALHYLLQVTAGLAHASARGVVHRDIKPSNIIITPNGRAKLVDMGLARCLETRPDKGLTQSGVTLGTFDYISPEQALEPRDADVRSDIYSLGCTFYHMLTGQSPVPEGTAAKKLHHHQHIKPTDPRELAPNVPDEVAMILARMLAKEPRDRYQTPEQLVHDLLRAARKLGVGGDVPEGVLAVEASLPRTTAYRPMLLVAGAAAVVVALILLLAPSATPLPGGQEQPLPKPKTGDGTPATTPVVHQQDPPTAPKNDVPPSGVARYDDPNVTVDKLANWLKEHDNADQIDIELARDLDWQVHDDAEYGLVVRARRVNIRAKDRTRRPTIRLGYSFAKLTPRAALKIDAKEATVEGLRVVLDSSSTHEAMTGLQFVGQPGGRYRVDRCEFTQARPSFDEQHRLASVVLDTTRSASGAAARALLALNECVFLGFRQLETQLEPGKFELVLTGADGGGQDAVVRRGPGRLDASNCAIGPHAAAFRFEGAAGGTDATTVTHCSVLAGRGSTAFYFFDDAAATLDVRSSLFSRPGAVTDQAGGAFLIRQPDARASAVFQGVDNRYHNLDGYWAGDGHEETNYESFVRLLGQKMGELTGDDRDSRVLTESPWADDLLVRHLEERPMRYFVQFDGTRPLADDAAAQQAEEDQLAELFQVKANRRDLRSGADPKRSLIGVEKLGQHTRYADNLRPLEDPKPDPLARRKLIVDPDGAGSSDTYDSLQKAVLNARPGDLILIRKNGDMRVEPIDLKKASIDLTIRPESGSQPVLVIGDTQDADASLFRLLDGKLRLEDLEFRLQPPAKPQFRSQSVVALVGDGQCSFVNCVLTLGPGAQETPLAAVTLTDNGDVMKMKSLPPGSVPPAPRLVFDTCFVRGNGDLIWSRVSRPFDLALTNSLLALHGNVLNVEVADTTAAVPSLPNVSVMIGHTTAYVAGYFLRLKVGKELKGLVPLQCEATASLFVAASGGTFIHLDGPETNDDKLKEKLLWTGKQNLYGGYTELFAQQATGEDPRTPPKDPKDWKMFTGETSEFVARMPFATPPGATAFARMMPAQFKPKDTTAGVDVQTTPKPSSDDR